MKLGKISLQLGVMMLAMIAIRPVLKIENN